MLAFLQTNTPIVIFNQIVVTLLTVCFLYQVVFFVIGALRGEVAPPKAKKLHRYAFFIAAHNEEAVIANLVRSIKDQDYPSELIEVFVVADACTDNTAQLAREAGAIVYERNDLARKGKSWVMDFGFDRILNEYPDTFEGYFIFDADNVISRDYVSKMNDAFDQGFHVVTSYRNSKNFGSSWISAANATWYLREARFLNNARNICKTSCAVSGSGYLISASVIEGMHGWQFHTLTEDIQFTTFCAIHGIRIGYAPAEFFDEQPVTFKASWKQRMRWTKGFYQVFFTYGKHLVKSTFRYHRFAAYDMFMTIAPGMLLSLISMLANATFLIVGGLSHGFLATEVEMQACAASLIMTFAMMYQTFFILALLTTIFEYKHIHCAQKWRLVTNLFTFPIFMFSYIPITVAALFLKVDQNLRKGDSAPLWWFLLLRCSLRRCTMFYIPFWICIFAGVAIDALERRFPNGLAGACAVAALAGVWLDLGLNTALDHAGLAVIVYLALVLTESLWRRLRHAPGIGMGDAKALFALCTFDPMGGIVAFTAALLGLAIACLITKSRSLPLLPFLVPIFAIIEVVGCTL